MKHIVIFENFIKKEYVLDYTYCDYYIRYSGHITDDLKRNWSSWNFGEYGFEGTKEEMKQAKFDAIKNNISLNISGFELWDTDIKNSDIRELYPNYWVLVDNTKTGGIAGHFINEKFDTVNGLVNFIKSKKHTYDGTGDGDFFDTEYAKVIYSEEPYGEWGFHIIEVGTNENNNIK